MLCGKTIYSSRREATNSIKGINKKALHKTRQIQQAYFCDQCNGWHLSSKRKKPIKQASSTTQLKTRFEDITKAYKVPLKPLSDYPSATFTIGEVSPTKNSL